MKPLNLKIAGLNSFRAEQEIQFDVLSDLGVFGIFGPTGSGKSSILDAMTLALYGTVVRAKRGIQGIINHAENKLAVSFTFALGAGPRRIYRVERGYKTRDHISVKNTHSRLVELTEGQEIVVAERDGDVTNYINNLLGLTPEDFMRAVVLPQGKFSEFLKMDGAGRRQMLERIFSLEKYGRGLVEKLNSRYETVNGQFIKLSGELQGLGDASRESLKQAETLLGQAVESEKAAAAHQEETGRHCEEGRRIFELQQELAGKEQELLNHRRQKEEFDRLTWQVQLADKASQVFADISARKGLAGQLDEVEKACVGIETHLQELETRTRDFEKALIAAKTGRQEREPKLIERKAQLEAAQDTEREAARLEEEIAREKGKMDELEANLANTGGAIGVTEERIARLAAEVAALENELAANTVDRTYRLQVQAAVQLAGSLEREIQAAAAMQQKHAQRKNRLTSARTDLCQAAAEEADLQRAADELRTRELAAGEQCPWQEENLVRQEVRLAELKAKLNELTANESKIAGETAAVDALTLELSGLGEQRDQLQSAYQDGKEKQELLAGQIAALLAKDHRRLAAQLAAGLREGQPCPVCGSIAHPVPALVSPEEGAGGEKELLEQEAEQLKINLEQTELMLRRHEAGVVAVQTRLVAAQKAVSDGRRQIAAELDTLAGEWDVPAGFLTVESAGSLAAAQAVALERAKAAFSAWRNERKQAAERLQELEQKFSRAKLAIAGLQASIAAAEEELKREQDNLSELERRVAGLSQELLRLLTALCSGEFIEPEELGGKAGMLAAQVADKDRRAEELRQKAGQNREDSRQFQDRLQELSNGKARINAALAGVQAKRQVLVNSREQKREELRRITQGMAARVLFEEVNAEIAGLRTVEQNAAEQYGEAEAARMNVEQNLTRRQAERSTLQEQLCRFAERITGKLKRLGFEQEEAAETAYIEDCDLMAMRQRMDAYTEQEHRLAAERDQFAAKLGDKRISMEEWKRLQSQAQEALAQKEQAMERRVAAENSCRDLVNRHNRWQEIENEMTGLTERLRHLETLRTLTRGNKLVEFMAQEQMEIVLTSASERLKQLTNHRYAIEIASDGSFLVRDDANGGFKRFVGTLSGGETFQTSLALALALSSQIQLRGQYPLEFFFLDEGFGSLDPEALEVVMSTLERLPNENMTIGVISHVTGLQQRMPRRLIVGPAEPAGHGSTVTIEIA
ncbi:Hypothetical protein LUCI_1835 [Lucifera butyrica]|uniref:Nuclease SbcCD subunit C n=1 Tax=Lucifera butyrica TaxID=1351585 RepID=A0A498R609_9FIRM|nr:AAA family ATPase [Lucifera butyrica]VBB06599.1 Hypothetical protein LUCI_1835 [Lucifera butyrica]